jgi:phage terminase large subunit-like protein
LLPGELESSNASDLTVRLSNGSKIYGYSADRPDRLRGANLSGAWLDEIASMVHADDLWGESLMPALRIGDNPQVVVTTTPRPIKILRELLARDDGSVRVIRGSTWDNAKNLSRTALENLRIRYENTRLGRQELEGELLTDIEGALWSRDQLDDSRVDRLDQAPEMVRIVVGVDPAVTSGEKADSTGIVVVGRDREGHLYVLEDATMKGSPHACMTRAVTAYHRWHADRIVGEVNNGGDYIEHVLRTVDANVAYKSVRATRGKTIRAEPIAALWEQGRAHLVGVMANLEDQMCSFTQDSTESPDNLDACFVGETPVLTARGEVPIESVAVGEFVWTRVGWKPVVRSGRTRRDAEVMTVELSDGRALTGTPDHRIWTGNGWARLDALVCGDILDGWSNTPYLSNSTVSCTNATLVGNSTRTRDGKYPLAGTSITSITTRSTTNPRTLSYSRRPRINSGTPTSTPMSSAMRCVPTPDGSVLCQSHGMPVRKDAPGIAHTVNAPGKVGSTSPASVSAAGRNIAARSVSPGGLGTVPGRASTASTISPAAISDGFRARCAVPSFGSPSTDRIPSRAAVSVRGCYVEPVRRDVYDLMVADQHEFVAAGVLVHNCVWAATELQMGGSAMVFLSSISKMCPSCDLPNSRRATHCRICGHSLAAAA